MRPALRPRTSFGALQIGLIKPSETVLRFCGPNPWLSHCWRNISGSAHADPRFHPSAWRFASKLIHTNRTRCRRAGCVPSSGAMAVLFALERCKKVHVYGFGVSGDGGAPKADGCSIAGGASEDTAATAAAARAVRVDEL